MSSSEAPLEPSSQVLVDFNEEYSEAIRFPMTLRVIATSVCAFLLIVGSLGNVLVPLVVLRTKELKNSTNIFLINLSVADILVLVTCAPTVLVELHSQPEVWFLGEFMCKSVSFIELLVAHSSVLTILGISIERYYAVCWPLEASSKCTRRRALVTIAFIWGLSLGSCLPMLRITKQDAAEFIDGSLVTVCTNSLQEAWHPMYYYAIFVTFFVVPFAILVVLYVAMSCRLISDSRQSVNSNQHKKQIQIRKQVVVMVATVCLTFFVCLFPFRIMTLWIINSTPERIQELGMEKYYSLLFFCRILIYSNSAINPILYNLISSKFRKAFCRTLRIRPRGSTYSTKSHAVVSERISTTLLRTGHSSPIIFAQCASPKRPKAPCETSVQIRKKVSIHSVHSVHSL